MNDFSQIARWSFRPQRRGLRVLLSVCLLLAIGAVVSTPAWARQRQPTRHRAAASGDRPVVEQVSPPNWWSNLPDPMLLLRGRNLANAEVTSSVPGISVERTQGSANGHWVFVWLDISAAPPQKFSLVVRTAHGRTRVHYELDKRHPSTAGFQGFSSSDVMYLILPDRFSDGDASNDRVSKKAGTFDRQNPYAYHGGDLAGIENHLDYLEQLGITTLWVTPLYAQDPNTASDYSGYAPVNFYRVNPHFGTLEDYENLAQALHQRGMKLVLDLVMNHVGPKSPWVNDPPAPDWFHGTVEDHLKVGDDFHAITNPHAPPAAYQSTLEGWFSNRLPDLNQSNPLVRKYLIQNAIWWVESGTLDGLRLDTYPYVNRDFWQDFHSVLHALYPHLTAVGEVFDSDPTVVSFFAGGIKHEGIDTGLDTLFDFPTAFALRAELAGASPEGGAPMTGLENIERQDWLYPHPERLVTFFGNQDMPRFLAEPGASDARLKLAFGLLATLRGMPQIYYGDEIGLSGGVSGGNGQGNRADFPGGFPGDPNNAFTLTGRTAAQQSMYAWVHGLLTLRAQHTALQTGAQQNLLADDTGFVFARIETAEPKSGSQSGSQSSNAATGSGAGNKSVSNKKQPGEILLVLMNKGTSARTFQLDFAHTALDGVASLAPLWNTNAPVTVTDNHCSIEIAADQLIILQARR